MNRRTVIGTIAAVLVVAPLGSFAQRPRKVWRMWTAK